MATKTGKAQSNANSDAMALLYGVNQLDAILEMLKDIKQMPRVMEPKLTNCPKCKAEQSMMVSAHLKWNVQDKWYQFLYCMTCGYEMEGKKI